MFLFRCKALKRFSNSSSLCTFKNFHCLNTEINPLSEKKQLKIGKRKNLHPQDSLSQGILAFLRLPFLVVSKLLVKRTRN